MLSQFYISKILKIRLFFFALASVSRNSAGQAKKRPGDAMSFYKHRVRNTFRRIRADDELSEPLVFERDNTDIIINIKFMKIIRKKQSDKQLFTNP